MWSESLVESADAVDGFYRGVGSPASNFGAAQPMPDRTGDRRDAERLDRFDEILVESFEDDASRLQVGKDPVEAVRLGA